MWRRAAKLASLRRFKISPQSSLTSPGSHSNLRLHRWPCYVDDAAHPMGSQMSFFGSPSGILGYSGSDRYYGSAAAAEAIVATSSEDDEEVRELVQEIKKLEKKNSAASLKQSEPAKDFGGMSPWKYNALRRRQQKVETEAWLQAAKEYQELLADMCEQKLAPNLPYMKSLFLGWFEPLRDAIQAEQDMCRQKSSRAAHGPYFVQLPADKMAVITMNKMMALLMSGDGHGHVHAKVVVAALQIGEAVENEVKIQSFFEKPQKKSSASGEPDEGSLEEQKAQERLRKKVTTLIKQQKVHIVRKIVKGHLDIKPWGQENQAKVGACLIQLLTETAFIQPPSDQLGDAPPDVRPAFIHTMQTFSDNSQKRTRNYGVIECDPLVRKGLEKTAKHMVIPYMPMLVPPEKWKGYEKGAYLFLNSFAMRTHGAREQRQAMKRTSFQQLEHVFLALDTLGSTKWKVNTRVLNVIDRIWAAGGRVADLVDREDNPLPEEPATDNEDEKKKWKWKVKAIKKENNERHSQRCDTELKLAVARKMQDEEGFYYPHNVDFRGRAYPIHPHLNHLGSDLCRGILEFADGKPLGKAGLRWLKIHLANLYARGVDKLSYDGRIEFAENHMNDIFDSADRPLEGKRWWLEAEDPFQCLAVCINLAEALRSSCPEAYVSHVPVHQDGSCNGLQHYAALGRDKLGAAAVNLMAGDKPADVYSDIAARVRDIMGKVAQKDPAIDPNVLHARALVNQIDRKLVKQTVMTSVYGVTFIGARDQIKKRLKERFPQEDDDVIFGWSCYAAKTTLFALEEKFEAATSIMSWLGDCAKIIASENHPVSWTTPLGLPVVQPYRHKGRHLIKTSLQVLTLQRDTDKVKAKRQKSAFPPNFVHSLDGSHMMMTAIACKKAGLSFAGVHDSYWTHAADVDEMNKILREKFVELYELPILESLLESFQQSFPQLDFPPLPDRGDFDLREVLQSPYFFN